MASPGWSGVARLGSTTPEPSGTRRTSTAYKAPCARGQTSCPARHPPQCGCTDNRPHAHGHWRRQCCHHRRRSGMLPVGRPVSLRSTPWFLSMWPSPLCSWLLTMPAPGDRRHPGISAGQPVGERQSSLVRSRRAGLDHLASRRPIPSSSDLCVSRSHFRGRNLR